MCHCHENERRVQNISHLALSNIKCNAMKTIDVCAEKSIVYYRRNRPSWGGSRGMLGIQ